MASGRFPVPHTVQFRSNPGLSDQINGFRSTSQCYIRSTSGEFTDFPITLMALGPLPVLFGPLLVKYGFQIKLIPSGSLLVPHPVQFFVKIKDFPIKLTASSPLPVQHSVYCCEFTSYQINGFQSTSGTTSVNFCEFTRSEFSDFPITLTAFFFGVKINDFQVKSMTSRPLPVPHPVYFRSN